MIDLINFQSINLSQFLDSVKFRSGSGYHLVIDFCIVMFYMLMILMKFSFVPQTFFRFFVFFRIRIRILLWIHWKKLFFIYYRYSPNLVSFLKVFVKIKILFKMRIRIRIMILLRISIPDLHFIHRRHPRNFVWIRQFLRKLLCPQQKSTYRQTDRETDKRKFFLLVLSSKTYKTWIFVKRREFFLFFTHAITILSLFTYSVCDEKVKKKTNPDLKILI